MLLFKNVTKLGALGNFKLNEILMSVVFYVTLQIINALKAENSVINTKLRRVEGENVLKVGTVCRNNHFKFVILALASTNSSSVS